MKSYRISKYKPLRIERRINENEWTSYSDVNKLVSLDEYLFIESEYIKTIVGLCECMKVEFLRIKELEIYEDSYNLFESKEIKTDDLEEVLKLILREEIWFKLISNKCQFHFGYDYYVYFTSIKEVGKCIDDISDKLFIEEFNSPYYNSDTL